MNGHPGNVPSVTGADKQVVLGSITPGKSSLSNFKSSGSTSYPFHR
jgi:hypothetical protein